MPEECMPWEGCGKASLCNPPRSRNGAYSKHGGRWRGGQTARQRAGCLFSRARAHGGGCTWWAEDLFEGAAVEDLEAGGGSHRKAALVLVESNVEHLVCRRSRQIYPARPHPKPGTKKKKNPKKIAQRQRCEERRARSCMGQMRGGGVGGAGLKGAR